MKNRRLAAVTLPIVVIALSVTASPTAKSTAPRSDRPGIVKLVKELGVKIGILSDSPIPPRPEPCTSNCP